MPDENELGCCKERSCIFMKYLYEEKNIHKNHRFQLIQRKLFFIGALLGISSLHPLNSCYDINFMALSYLVPIMAIAYDIFILAEDFKVKRVGAFLSKEKIKICQDERQWEAFVKNNREPLAAYGTVLLTGLASAVAVMLILKDILSDFKWISMALLAVIFVLLIIYRNYYWNFMESNKRLDEENARSNKCLDEDNNS